MLVGAADDGGDVNALPLQVDGLRGLLVPLAHDLEGRLAELGLDLLEGLAAVGRHDREVGRGEDRGGVGVDDPEGVG